MRHSHRIACLVLICAAFLGLDRLAEGQGRAFSARRIAGVASALVVDVKDPDASGRIRVRFPWLREGKVSEFWARVSLPLGGNTNGFFSLPEVGDEVLVAFEQGDLRQPVVLGSLWDGSEPPPPGGSSGELRSPNGLFSISVTDSGITLSGPHVVVQMNATDIQVNAVNTLVSSDGQTSITSGGATTINGAVIRLNGSNCPPVARVGDLVQLGELGVIVTGSLTVTSC